jgi:purine-cytosine permease-like protein
MSLILTKDEKEINKSKFTANLLLFWLKANYTLTNKRIAGETPNTFLGLIPFGKAKLSQPLKTVASVSSSTKFKFKRLIFGLILLVIGGSIGESTEELTAVGTEPAGMGFLGVIFILFGIINILNCYTATFSITNNSGQNTGYEISILEKSKVEVFVNKINNQIADL